MSRRLIPPVREGRGWVRATLLMAAALILGQSVFQSWSTAVLVVVTAFFLLAILLPRQSPWAFAYAAIAALILFTRPSGTLWFFERGWALLVAGWFVALTLRWPRAALVPRAFGAAAGAGVVSALIFWQRPGDWIVVETFVSGRLETLRASLSEALSGPAVGPDVAAVMATVIERTIEIQRTVFPGVLIVASIAALAVAWWLYVRISLQRRDGLRRLAEFRFHDGLIWMVVAGMAFLLFGSGDVLARTGWNTLVVIGALYALRGAAVIAFVLGGLSVVNAVLMIVTLLFLPAFILSVALIVGLSDTWLDLRERARAVQDSGS